MDRTITKQYSKEEIESIFLMSDNLIDSLQEKGMEREALNVRLLLRLSMFLDEELSDAKKDLSNLWDSVDRCAATVIKQRRVIRALKYICKKVSRRGTGKADG